MLLNHLPLVVSVKGNVLLAFLLKGAGFLPLLLVPLLLVPLLLVPLLLVPLLLVLLLLVPLLLWAARD